VVVVAAAFVGAPVAAAADPPRQAPRDANRDAATLPGDASVAPVLIVVAVLAGLAGLAWLTMGTRPAVLVESTNSKGAPEMSRFSRRRREAEPPPEDGVSDAGVVPLKGRLDAYSAAPQLRDLGAVEEHVLVPARSGAELDPRAGEVLRVAEEAAEQILADASRDADELRRAAAAELERATEDAEKLRADAEAEASSTRARADEHAELLRREAEEEVEALRAEAEADARELRADGEAVREELAREGLERHQQLEDATRALELRLGGALSAVQSITAELDGELAREDEAPAGESPVS
jgi:hypothetical protein